MENSDYIGLPEYAFKFKGMTYLDVVKQHRDMYKALKEMSNYFIALYDVLPESELRDSADKMGRKIESLLKELES